jgi:putative ABC transport system permease protein
MLRSLFNVTIRHISRNAAHSVINLFGLTIGFSACMLVTAIVWNGLSYDRQWSHRHELYRVMTASNDGKVINHDFNIPTGLGPALKQNFPQVADYCRLRNTIMNLAAGKSQQGVSANCLTGDPSVLHMLDIHILEGNPRQWVNGYPNLIISRQLKDELFPDTDPIGKIVTRTSDYSMPYEGKKKQYVITGVMENLPTNSHFFAGALLLDGPWPGENDLTAGFGTALPQYILVKPGTDMPSFTARVNDWYAHFSGNQNTTGFTFFFQPLTSIHLHPEIGNDPDTTGSLHNICIYIGIAVLIMIIVSFNYVNLSLAISIQKIQQIGIRSVLGANRFQIIFQSLSESILFFLISFTAASILFALFLGPAGKFVGHSLTLSTAQYILLYLFSGLLLLIIITGCGFYPAWLLARINPVLAIRGSFIRIMDTGFIRKTLITGQFIISIVIFIFMFVVRRQLEFLNHKDLGFDKNNLLCIDNNAWGTKGHAFKQELLKIAGVTNVSISSWNPSLGEGSMSMDVDDKKDSAKKIRIWYIGGDYDLTSTLKFQLIKGNSLSDRYADSSNPLLITAYTASLLGVKDLNYTSSILQGKPIGVLKDFNNGSLRYAMTPCVVTDIPSPGYGYMLIRTSGQTNKQLPDRLKELWRQFYPDKLLQFSWISESLSLQYAEEERLQKCFSTLGLLSIFLACLGLFGLVSFSVDLRVREIGIRKAMGAPASRIIILLSGSYLRLVLIAIAIASPIALWIGTVWLREFAYRIGLTWGMFVIVWLFIFCLAMLTLGLKVGRAALQNPVIALRER